MQAKHTRIDADDNGMSPDGVFLAEGTWGPGHSTEVIGLDGFVSLVFALPPKRGIAAAAMPFFQD